MEPKERKTRATVDKSQAIFNANNNISHFFGVPRPAAAPSATSPSAPSSAEKADTHTGYTINSAETTNIDETNAHEMTGGIEFEPEKHVDSEVDACVKEVSGEEEAMTEESA